MFSSSKMPNAFERVPQVICLQSIQVGQEWAGIGAFFFDYTPKPKVYLELSYEFGPTIPCARNSSRCFSNDVSRV